MEKIKSILLAFLAAVLVVAPFNGTSVKAAEKVKVYIFEAGGCPYCEAEIEYLKSLDSYNKKFEIVQKELYVDHVNWEPGKDYELGKLVAEAFQQVGFEDASYQGTPFVVISNVYAVSSYSESLEDYINLAYEKGDADVVGCYEKGGTECLEGATVTALEDLKSDSSSNTSGVVRAIVLILIVGGIVLLAIFGRKSTIDDEDYSVEKVYEEKEEPEVIVNKKVANKSKSTKNASKPKNKSKK